MYRLCPTNNQALGSSSCMIRGHNVSITELSALATSTQYGSTGGIEPTGSHQICYLVGNTCIYTYIDQVLMLFDVNIGTADFPAYTKSMNSIMLSIIQVTTLKNKSCLLLYSVSEINEFI